MAEDTEAQKGKWCAQKCTTYVAEQGFNSLFLIPVPQLFFLHSFIAIIMEETKTLLIIEKIFKF